MYDWSCCVLCAVRRRSALLICADFVFWSESGCHFVCSSSIKYDGQMSESETNRQEPVQICSWNSSLWEFESRQKMCSPFIWRKTSPKTWEEAELVRFAKTMTDLLLTNSSGFCLVTKGFSGLQDPPLQIDSKGLASVRLAAMQGLTPFHESSATETVLWNGLVESWQAVC